MEKSAWIVSSESKPQRKAIHTQVEPFFLARCVVIRIAEMENIQRRYCVPHRYPDLSPYHIICAIEEKLFRQNSGHGRRREFLPMPSTLSDLILNPSHPTSPSRASSRKVLNETRTNQLGLSFTPRPVTPTTAGYKPAACGSINASQGERN